MVLHCGGIGFRIGQDFASRIDDGDASAGGLSFLGGDVGEGVASAVGFDAMSEELRFLDKVAFDFCAQRSLPGAADHEVEGGGGGQDDEHERRQQLEEY